MSEVPGITVLAPSSAPAIGHIAFVHGILGSGMNWRGFARKLMSRLPGRGALLIDLALHGALRDGRPGVPDTLAGAAEDLVQRLRQGGWAIDAVAGHSFGGKVALLAAQALASDRRRQLWVLDSPPGARPDRSGSETTLLVLSALGELAPSHESRAGFVSALQEKGVDRAVAQWLATNLREQPDGHYRFTLDRARIQTMLEDFFAQDLWPVVDELAEDPNWDIDLIFAGRSSLFVGEQARARDARVQAGQIRAHQLPNAGHWLHVDDPQGLLDRMVLDISEA